MWRVGPSLVTPGRSRSGAPSRGARHVYRTEAAEFELSRLEWADGEDAPVTLAGGTPRILVTIDGAVRVSTPATEMDLPRGRSAWLPANDPPVTITPLNTARTRAFAATPGPA